MSNTHLSSGQAHVLVRSFETRHILVAEGIDFHASDYEARNARRRDWADRMERYPEGYDELVDDIERVMGRRLPPEMSQAEVDHFVRYARSVVECSGLDHLQRVLGDDLTVSDEGYEFTSEPQRVHYVIRTVRSRRDFRQALETPDLHVIYSGHSRYGRGACFDPYEGHADPQGEQWEQGNDLDDGLFRLGYPYVGVSLHDLQHHAYTFRPVPVEDGPPDPALCHPAGRHGLETFELPASLQGAVTPYFESASRRYFGFVERDGPKLLLHAGWNRTVNREGELGSTELRCRVFCHFGCSSRTHYHDIVRDERYKNWSRPTPPTDRFAYFTTAASDYRATGYWLEHLLRYPHDNAGQPWWESLEHAKREASRQLRAEGSGYEIF